MRCHVLNPAPILVAVAVAVLAVVPVAEASSHPAEDPPSIKGVAPVLAVLAVTAALVAGLALRGAGFGVTGPIMVLGIAAAALVTVHTGAWEATA